MSGGHFELEDTIKCYTTSGAGTAYPFEAPEFTPGFLAGFVLLDL